jgi:hypothetical protein
MILRPDTLPATANGYLYFTPNRLTIDTDPVLPGSLDRLNFKQWRHDMGTITTRDGTEIFYKDWGSGRPIVFHHGWPLSADDWDNQMLFFLEKATG